MSIPLNIFLKEASELSGFVEKYWQKTADRPGLAVASQLISENVKEEIPALIQEILNLHKELANGDDVEPREVGVSLKARKWISEMHQMLKWLLQFPAAKPLNLNLSSAIRAYRKQGKSAPRLRKQVEMLLVLAEAERDALSSVPELTDDFLKEGERLSKALGNVRRGRSGGSSRYRELLSKKNSLIHILLDRVNRVRSAARFVFRNHKSIQKLASSDFERKRRRKNRAKKEKELPAPSPKSR